MKLTVRWRDIFGNPAFKVQIQLCFMQKMGVLNVRSGFIVGKSRLSRSYQKQNTTENVHFYSTSVMPLQMHSQGVLVTENCSKDQASEFHI